jgi:competence protein ComEC
MKRHALPAAERNLFLPALAGFFIAGVWLAPRVCTGLWPLWLLPLAALMLAPLRVLKLPLRLICLPLALMLAMLWTQYWLNPAMPEEGKVETITATVYGDSKITDAGNVSFAVTDVSLDGVPQRGRAYASVYVPDGTDSMRLTDGMRIRFSGKVYHPGPKENVYDFDYRMWMRQHGLNYGITSVEDIELISSETPWTNYAQRIAEVCHERLAAVMGDKADLAVAMLLGWRNALAEDDAAAFQRAGVAHIMAVSGLHVGILSLALLWLLERLRMRRKLQIPIVAAFLLLYCGITGFAVASLRAGVMVMLWVVAGAYGRKTNPVTILSTAMLIVLVINPLQLFSAGFALSFSAMAGIFLLYPRFLQGLDRVLPDVKAEKRERYERLLQWFVRRVKQALAVTLSAQLGVLLPIAAYYHHLYPYSLLFNLLIVPMVGGLVPLYAVTAAALFLPWIGGWLGAALGAVSGLGSEILLRLVRLSNALPLAEIRVAQPNAWIYIAAFTCAVTVSHFVRASVRRRLIAIAAIAVVAAAGSYAQSPPPLRYHQFAAGWADSALIVDGDTAIGIDTGNTGSEMINRLLAEGRDLDALILTHLHADHAGGVDEILDEGIRIKRVYLPSDYEKHGYSGETLSVLKRLEAEGVPVACLAAGDTLEFHETTIDVLWPQPGRTREGIDPNDRSLAMLITLGDVRILSMADNGMLYERYAAAPADVLKAGHHGSKGSSGEDFLKTVDPALAIFTVRSDTTLASSALNRFAALDIRMLRTDETGEIVIVPARDGYRTYRTLPEEKH